MSTEKTTPPTSATEPAAPADTLGRPLRDLRISVTDRCNFRCPYCMPKEVFGRKYKFLPKSDLLTFEEITRLAAIFSALGVRKLRLTGGEPTIRRGLPKLVRMLSAVDGIEDLAMTTNASRLATMAPQLHQAGLQRVTVSLDSLDDARFREMSGAEFPVGLVLEGIEAARRAGLLPVKINVVVKRGVNEDDALAIARRFAGADYIVRFIEYMDVGTSNGWHMKDVVPAAEIIEMIGRELPLEAIDPNYRGEVARRWRYAGGKGEIGVIASVTEPFCGDCTRARLSADGQLYTCLFAVEGHDLRQLLRDGADDEEIEAFLRTLWSRRTDRYSEERTDKTATQRHKVEMSYIGG
ncbi:MAG: GTP 3',8-cyclase MoaA [Chloroflexi bacterium]|nr:GTP 3',8-cyclase MoaA [Chloroflexota bacterium]MCI0818453.1 GTP 3',8-cyclase MoaA [Chloroflexota bacterium]MCI0832823.1 GTP 3',8-cyclase MoaA [Chloroflexota bacterium]MCI0843144.1 GTP 3',8-cyclase MoaA [Chloroflexota bacterium]MCI0884292.1 GTP 3',8-cyclase MoaA [Chloroflexota bacterium]